MKVSFDFDSTLSRHDVQRFAKELINDGVEVWIVTSRISNEQAKLEYKDNYTLDRIYKSNKKLFRVADNVGIKREHINFCNFTNKIEFIKGKNFIFHLDDDSDELIAIFESKDSCQPINVNHMDWEIDCRLHVGVEKYLENPNEGFENELRDSIITQLNNIQYPHYDESDLGNEIGIVLGEHLNPEQIEAFIMGLKHGISLTNGTHG